MVLRSLMAGALVLLVAACGGDDGQGQIGSTRCSTGEKKACACTNGGSGFKTCGDDERWDACVCGVGPADTVGGDDPGADPDTLGGDDTGSTGDQACVPRCSGKQCGPDACGGTCGTCPGGLTCGPDYQCQAGPCVPDCAGRECGPDSCGGSCGSCDPGLSCETWDGGSSCVEGCVPDCTDLQCGSDGCGGSCGSCGAGSQCSAGTCEPTCTPSCTGKQCGPDGCGGSCGACAGGATCQAGQCVADTPGLTCQQLFVECFPTCGTSDTACAQACYGDLSATGKAEADAFMGCMQTNGCYEAADPNQCMVSSCFGEYLGCFHGTDSCPQIAVCLDGCPYGDSACWGDCLAEGTTDAQIGLYNQIDQCLVTNCCPDDVAVCNEAAGQECITAALDATGACAWPKIACP